MPRSVVSLLVALALTPLVTSAQIVSLVGDKDCFGLGGTCPDGTLWRDQLGGVFFNSYQTDRDPTFTDVWSAPAFVSWTHRYAVPTSITSATLLFRSAGLADNQRGPVDVFFESHLVGTIPSDRSVNAFQKVRTWTFAVDPTWLTGHDVASFTPHGDGFSIDYAELTIVGVSAVPEPATLALVGGGLLVLGAVTRRRRA